MDIVSSSKRSEMMAGIKGRNTRPEIAVRRIAHQLGLRFRLHRKDLPGSPDLVFPRHKTAVFVHGCYWHRHPGCRLAYSPKSNITFWTAKFEGNVARDIRDRRELEEDGWKVVIIWECQSKNVDAITSILKCEVCNGGQ
ncbi:very short patch repair endonuclease [Rhizobium multihospitium]|uniref:Very short patch repair endonuclease n=1 Tax=Rhizobium multihospitium TaxID=410764 RepID=A0A1C3VSI2_9HYPH|nr:very short patch repair endonuclease [Rhizobium multihospitium]SCB30732.1 T/G mismatch-specific endonuclease [Rhizobium multihospitium]